MKHGMRMKTGLQMKTGIQMERGIRREHGIRMKRGGIWRRWIAGVLAAVMLAELVPVYARRAMRRMARRRGTVTLRSATGIKLQRYRIVEQMTAKP